MNLVEQMREEEIRHQRTPRILYAKLDQRNILTAAAFRFVCKSVSYCYKQITYVFLSGWRSGSQMKGSRFY